MIYEVWAGIMLAVLTLFGGWFVLAVIIAIVQMVAERNED